MDRLESRKLLAGDVTVTFDSGMLSIIGDELNNQIEILYSDSSLQIEGTSATSVNGQRKAIVFDDVLAIEVELRGGNDRVLARELELAGGRLANVMIDGGLGDDRIELRDATLINDDPEKPVSIVVVGEHNTNVASKTGNDSLRLINTEIVSEFALSRPMISISGEVNSDSAVWQGNDRIDIDGLSAIVSENDAETSLGDRAPLVQIHGETNLTGNQLIGGNDKITVRNVDVHVESGIAGQTGAVFIAGEYSEIGNHLLGGTDVIHINGVNLFVEDGLAASAPVDRSDPGLLTIVGSVLQSDNEVHGSNDQLSLNDVGIAASGGIFNRPILSVLGHDVQNDLGESGGNAIYGGNDRIRLYGVGIKTEEDFVSHTGVAHILGEFNADSTTQTGGNDRVDVVNLSLSVSQNRPSQNALNRPLYVAGSYNWDDNQVFGDNDWFTINETQIQMLGSQMNSPTIIGEFSNERNRLLGGNDRFNIVDLQVLGDPTSAQGIMFNSVASLEVFGSSFGSENEVLGDNDRIHLRGVRIGDGTASRAASLRLFGDRVGENSSLVGGNDRISIIDTKLKPAPNLQPGGQSNATLFIDADATLSGGAITGGNDSIEIRDTKLQANNGGAGSFAVLQVLAGSAGVQAGGGRDRVRIDTVDVISGDAPAVAVAQVIVNTDAAGTVGGRDRVQLRSVRAVKGSSMFGIEQIAVRTGAEGDRVRLIDTVAANLFVELSGGNDRLTLDQVFAEIATLDGGDDVDLFRSSNSDLFEPVNFENLN
ncbi:MAG: hypothetical protein AAF802_03550 [Planctomycetota bacterium]